MNSLPKKPSLIKSILPKSFFGRAVTILLVPTLLVLTLSVWIFYDRHWETMTRRLSQAITNDVGMILYFIQDKNYPPTEVIDLARKKLLLNVSFSKEAILPNLPLSKNNFLDTALANHLSARVNFPFRLDTSNFRKNVIIYVQLPNYVVRIDVPGKRLSSTTTTIFLLWMLGSALLLYSIAVIFLYNQVRALRRLSTSVAEFGKGRDQDAPFTANSAIEIREATNAFNNMRNQINRFIRQRTDMLSAISHDLRTPMTRIKLQLALMQKNQETESIENNLNEMEQMITSYLTFAKGEGTEKASMVNISDFMMNIVHKWQQEKTPINTKIEHDITLLLRPIAFARCIDNLLSNAMKFADNIWLDMKKNQDSVIILIEDDGCGIDEEYREDMLRPFQKQDHHDGVVGTGLGLAIAHDIVQLHGGHLALDHSQYGGLCVRITLFL